MTALSDIKVKRRYDAKAVSLSRFLSGSWDAYHLIEYDPPLPFTTGDVIKAMDIFRKDYKTCVIVKSHPELVLWELHLESRGKRMRTRRSWEGAANRPTWSTKFRFAVNVEYELLFANRSIPKKIHKELCRSLDCREFKALSLQHSDPINLLMLYRQANETSPGAIKLQYQEKLFTRMDHILSGFSISNEVEAETDHAKDIHLKLGCKTDEIPCIRKITAEVEDVPLKTKIPALKGFRLKNVDLELSAASTYHLYVYLGEMGVINSIPRWVADTREKGKTHCKAKFA
ncbi:uncharacterized protein LOC122260628 [Penaeus japonicus]|uniref:uncharacterized protein LOC122260628 n=1 Tax=Penaeus japonicus TaxID=27405 RepID=UPI001C715713|nr:uncharacterized protein LOC122260628 [Penaeus japonicus]